VERRPSWSGGFVRRAVEADPAFEVASVVRASRGIDARAGDAPAALTPSALERFDVLVVGAPEELRGGDLEAIRVFMADRGGTVFFLPDRRPSGPYASFVTANGFDEVLLEAPVTLQPAGGDPTPSTKLGAGPSTKLATRRSTKLGTRRSTGLATGPRASEFAIPRAPDPAMKALASLADGRPAIVARPVGDGQLIFSGALDAWRFRGDRGDAFAAFWRASIAAAALGAPPAVRVALDPGVVKPGAKTRVVARIRRTELEQFPDGSVEVPVVRAVAIATGEAGRRAAAVRENEEPVRLWPGPEPGVFEGRFTPLERGSYAVHVITGSAQDTALTVEADLPDAIGGDDEEAAIVASGTGGVVAASNDLTPVANHLRSLRRTELDATAHPMRSGWWTLPFALALCAEWTMRRRRGER
jgi:hypothetical protein